jgi:hypothetical protein
VWFSWEDYYSSLSELTTCGFVMASINRFASSFVIAATARPLSGESHHQNVELICFAQQTQKTGFAPLFLTDEELFVLDTTRSALVKTMPDGADENGFGNRFLFVYVFRRQLCPLGGPEHDWSNEVIKLYEAISFAKKQGCVGLTPSAKTTWVRMYTEIENNHLPGLAGKMTSRAGAHIRRIALIYAMLDLAPQVDVRHLRAAERLWNYCADSAQYIFNGTTKNQIKLLQWLEKQQTPVTLSNIRDDFYHRNVKVEQVKAIVADLVRMKRLQQTGDTYQIVNK